MDFKNTDQFEAEAIKIILLIMSVWFFLLKYTPTDIEMKP